MMSTPLISVVIPVFNTKNYLEKCLDSILCQTYDNYEMIVVDDGSTDGSGEYLDEFSKRDSRIRVIHQQNSGAVKARKNGTNNSQGEYIVYVDSDDWIEEGAFEEYVKIINEYNPDIIEFGFTKEYAGMPTRRSVQLKPGYYDKEQFEQAYAKVFDSTWPFVYAVNDVLWSKIIRKDLLLKCQDSVDNSITMGGDTALSVLLQIYLNSIYISDRAFYHFNVREGSITYSITSEKYSSYYELNKHFSKIMSYPFCKPIYAKNMIIRSFELLLDYLNVVPDNYFLRFERLPFFYNVKKNDRVVVYGKGKYAKNFISIIERFSFARVVANVDSLDYYSVLSMLSPNDYDVILIAIADYITAKGIVDNLKNSGFGKVRCLDYGFMEISNLPQDIADLYR